MAATSSIAGSQTVTQSALQELRLQQARQNAGRAEQVARSLQRQAADAQRDVDRAEASARSLAVQSEQAQNIAGRVRQGLAALRSVGEMQSRLSATVDQVSVQLGVVPVTNESAEVTSAPTPVINTSGQLTGTVVNTTA